MNHRLVTVDGSHCRFFSRGKVQPRHCLCCLIVSFVTNLKLRFFIKHVNFHETELFRAHLLILQSSWYLYFYTNIFCMQFLSLKPSDDITALVTCMNQKAGYSLQNIIHYPLRISPHPRLGSLLIWELSFHTSAIHHLPSKKRWLITNTTEIFSSLHVQTTFHCTPLSKFGYRTCGQTDTRMRSIYNVFILSP